MDVPSDMMSMLAKTIEIAGEEMDEGEVTALAEIMQALCLDLTDIQKRYFVIFSETGEATFALADPGVESMLVITTTAETFHKMAVGESNPAMEFALRKVKMTGVPLTKLTKVGGPLIDRLFKCYCAALQ